MKNKITCDHKATYHPMIEQYYVDGQNISVKNNQGFPLTNNDYIEHIDFDFFSFQKWKCCKCGQIRTRKGLVNRKMWYLIGFRSKSCGDCGDCGID